MAAYFVRVLSASVSPTAGQPGLARDRDGAMRMTEHGVAHRPRQQRAKSRSPRRTDDHQGGVLGSVSEGSGCRQRNRLSSEVHVWILLRPSGNRLGEHSHARIELVAHRQRPVATHRRRPRRLQPEGMDSDERRREATLSCWPRRRRIPVPARCPVTRLPAPDPRSTLSGRHLHVRGSPCLNPSTCACSIVSGSFSPSRACPST
jgi:hypothetical protein